MLMMKLLERYSLRSNSIKPFMANVKSNASKRTPFNFKDDAHGTEKMTYYGKMSVQKEGLKSARDDLLESRNKGMI